MALVGATGAGKSTLAKLLTRQYDPQRGSIALGGVDLRDGDARARCARRIVMLPQEGHLFSGTIADNVRLADPEASDEEVRPRAASRSARSSASSRCPRDSHRRPDARACGSRPASVSWSGSRAWRSPIPAVIVLDEATSSLDPATEAAVERALAAVVEGRTVIMIAHRLSTAERADRVVVMERGRVVEVASHDELVDQGERYARLWASWQAGVSAGTA